MVKDENFFAIEDSDLIQHAKSLKIQVFDSQSYLVTVSNAWKNADVDFRYILYKETIPQVTNAEAIKIPIQSAIVTSTSHLPPFEYLQALDVLKGFPVLSHISSQAILAQHQAGKLQDVGTAQGINLEKVMDMEPELVMAFAMGSEYDVHQKLKRAGIPVLLNADYMEPSALARAEWIKLFGLLLGKYEAAEAYFNQVKNAFDSLTQLSLNVPNRPQVMSGIMYGDVWYAPGGSSWAAEMLQLAGGEYLWKDENESGSLKLSYESVLDMAAEADVWIGAANFGSLTALTESDHRYANFQPLKSGRIYTYTKRLGEKGGNDYLESGYYRPDLILADLIAILHPDLLPDYETYYYQALP
jgi:iron complex transport system substrate-binding protein